MTTCFVCGREAALVRPLHTLVYGSVERVAYVYVCLPCWQARTNFVEMHSRAGHDAGIADANDQLCALDAYLKRDAEGEEWKGGCHENPNHE